MINKDQVPFYVIMAAHRYDRKAHLAINTVFNQSYGNVKLLLSCKLSLSRQFGTFCSRLKKMLGSDVDFYIHGDNDYGVSHLRNRSLLSAKNESGHGFIAYLDIDNQWDKNYASEMVNMISNSQRQAAYCGQTIYSKYGYLDMRDNGSDRMMGPLNHESFLEHNCIDINAFCHTNEVAEGIWFDESLKRLGDWDFIIGISKRTKFWSIPIVMSHYDNSDSKDRISNKEDFDLYYKKVRAKHA